MCEAVLTLTHKIHCFLFYFSSSLILRPLQVSRRQGTYLVCRDTNGWHPAHFPKTIMVTIKPRKWGKKHRILISFNKTLLPLSSLLFHYKKDLKKIPLTYFKQPSEHRITVWNKFVLVLASSLICQSRNNQPQSCEGSAQRTQAFINKGKYS